MDLFPRTNGLIFRGFDIHLEQSSHVETVVLLTREKSVKSYAFVDVSTDELELGNTGKADSQIFKACLYYITIAMLLTDPLYLSILCVFFGGGDMNGIALLFPEWAVRIFFGVMLVIHCLLFWRIVLPRL